MRPRVTPSSQLEFVDPIDVTLFMGDVLAVAGSLPCASCHAEPGHGCRTSNNKPTGPHVARSRAAEQVVAGYPEWAHLGRGE